MFSRLRTSPALRRLVWGLALLLPLSVNSAAAEMCDMPAESMESSHHMAMPGDHGGMNHGDAGDCGDSVCQAVCASVAAMATAQATPAPAILHTDTGRAPDTTPRAGHPQPPLRPPLCS